MNIETAGSRLKKIRQERGLSLEDVQKKTKIHLNVLRAIEGDSISNLSPIYLKGFIKIYCGYLGLDAKDFIGQSGQSQKPALNATVGRPIGTRIEKKSSFIKDASVKLGAIKPPVNLKKIIIFAAIAVIFIFLGINLIKFASLRPKSRLEKAKISMPVSAPKAVARQTKINKDLTGGFTLGIFARGKSWISVKVDGKVVFHGVLARGRSETWQAKEKVELSLGDAGAVELQVNDQRFANLGRHGQSLKNIVINKEGLKISR
ncbi:MAG: helix-turn-helix domain-containing protein [Candidatus Omnitrophota bacterium]|nr:helix-turn-helix domain-containing protein [Candidatus Omnitrophota bacterium]